MARRKGISLQEQKDFGEPREARKGVRTIVEEVLRIHKKNLEFSTFLSNAEVHDRLDDAGVRCNIKSVERAHKSLMEQRLLEKGKSSVRYSGYRLIPDEEREKRAAVEELLSELQEFDAFEDDATRLVEDCSHLQRLLAEDRNSRELMEVLRRLKEGGEEVSEARRPALEMIGSFLSAKLNLSVTRSEKVEANKINEAFCRRLLGYLLRHNLGLARDGESFFEESSSALRRRNPTTVRMEDNLGSFLEFYLSLRFLPIEEISQSNDLRPLLGRSTYRDIYRGKIGPSTLIAVMSEDDLLLSVYDRDKKGIGYLQERIRGTFYDFVRLSRPELDGLRHTIDELMVSVPAFVEGANELTEKLKDYVSVRDSA